MSNPSLSPVGNDPPHSTDPPSSDDPARPTDSPANPALATDGGGPATDDTPEEGNDADAVAVEEGPGGREVVVPLSLYKRVTVVSTLVAMVSIVAGFILLDRATNRARLPVSQVDPWLALAGLGLIAAGAVTYAYSTRFRAAGMGSSKTDENGPSDNG